MFRRIRKCFRVTGIFERRHEHKQGGSLSPRIVISTADHLRQRLDLFFAYIAGLGCVREVHIDDAFARIGAMYEFSKRRIVCFQTVTNHGPALCVDRFIVYNGLSTSFESVADVECVVYVSVCSRVVALL